MSAALDPAARKAAARRAWLDLLGRAAVLAGAVVGSDGEARTDDLDLRGALRMLADTPFPSDEASSQRAGEAFIAALRALLLAERPRRKAILAEGVKATARAVTEVFDDESAMATAVWASRLGARG